MQGYTQLYRAIHSYAVLYTAIQSYVQLYRAIHSYTQVYGAVQSYTELYRGTACLENELLPKYIEALSRNKDIVLTGDLNCDVLQTIRGEKHCCRFVQL